MGRRSLRGQRLAAVDTERMPAAACGGDIVGAGDPVCELGSGVGDAPGERRIVQIEPASLVAAAFGGGAGLDGDDLEIGVGIAGRVDAQQPVVRAHQAMPPTGVGDKPQGALAPALAVFQRGGNNNQMIDGGLHLPIIAWGRGAAPARSIGILAVARQPVRIGDPLDLPRS